MITPLILEDPEIMGGTPCIRGTRITVYAVAGRLNGGETVGELLIDYPYLTAPQIEAAHEFAAHMPFEEHPEGHPWRAAKARPVAA
jgi:uncharacterized protein (DUF433 family)